MPSLQVDYWALRSGEEAHRQHPDTFWIPTREARESLRRGQAAKLMFQIEVNEQGKIVVLGERMWVIVAEKINDTYIGILDNKPASFDPVTEYLCFGAEIPFHAEHVIDVDAPPTEYVDWQLGQAPEKRWPRD